jgi:hypothetical protein
LWSFFWVFVLTIFNPQLNVKNLCPRKNPHSSPAENFLVVLFSHRVEKQRNAQVRANCGFGGIELKNNFYARAAGFWRFTFFN